MATEEDVGKIVDANYRFAQQVRPIEVGAC
jgi:hypothetical protein